MNDPIYLNLVVEDEPSEIILKKIIQNCKNKFIVNNTYGKKGSGYIKNKIAAFNHASSKTIPFLVLIDLDNQRCAPFLVQELLPVSKHNNLILRVAAKEIESWIIADCHSLLTYLGVSHNKVAIPNDTDQINNPKQYLINIAKKSRKKNIINEIVPKIGSTAKIGPNYNSNICFFIHNIWNLESAVSRSTSLSKTFNALMEFEVTKQRKLSASVRR